MSWFQLILLLLFGVAMAKNADDPQALLVLLAILCVSIRISTEDPERKRAKARWNNLDQMIRRLQVKPLVPIAEWECLLELCCESDRYINKYADLPELAPRVEEIMDDYEETSV